MADQSQKTEKPTPRRKREAKRKGEIARSQEVAIATSLLGAALVLRAFGGAVGRSVLDDAEGLIRLAATGVDGATVRSMAVSMFVAGALPFAAVGTLFAVVAGVGQTGFGASPEALKPKLSRLSPKQGMQRFKPSTATWELARTALKLGLLAAAIYQPVVEAVTSLVGVHQLRIGLDAVMAAVWTILLRALLMALLIAGADYVFQRHKVTKSMRMTKEEVKQEAKHQEGDPLVKGQRRRRALDLSRNRLINVTTADVVVTNPTHYAVALAYLPPEPAPRVVAKGTDRQAKKIRKIAARHGVPIIEHRPLARSLYRKAKVGQFVPSALYEAAAVVLAEAYRRTKRRPAA